MVLEVLCDCHRFVESGLGPLDVALAQGGVSEVVFDCDRGRRVPNLLVNVKALRVSVQRLLEIAFEASDFTECIDRSGDALLALELGLDLDLPTIAPPRGRLS